MLQVWQKPHVRIGKRRARAGLQAVQSAWRVLPSDDVQPFLDIAFVLELGFATDPGSCEKLVQVESSKSPVLAIASSSSGI